MTYIRDLTVIKSWFDDLSSLSSNSLKSDDHVSTKFIACIHLQVQTPCVYILEWSCLIQVGWQTPPFQEFGGLGQQIPDLCEILLLFTARSQHSTLEWTLIVLPFKCHPHKHCSDITQVSWHLKSLTVQLCVQQLVQTDNELLSMKPQGTCHGWNFNELQLGKGFQL